MKENYININKISDALYTNTQGVDMLIERVKKLDQEVAKLKQAVAKLKQAVAKLKQAKK
ncbi:hypothetical protein [Helicobacter pylori]|uniref:hypothetical protein n=1 Tax=Helicobacter pylori TaxID=210 RepID=UPI001FD2EE65|nr:hypothetical protein [Helicobacter pylori]UOS10101.1 hypothetical protein MPG73_07415 [Helicobacter pylori]